MNSLQLWDRYREYLSERGVLGVTVDISRMRFPDDYFCKMEGPIRLAFRKMRELEKGALANPDEKRMVGHYWLRNPSLAPRLEIGSAIEENINNIKSFAARVHSGKIHTGCGKPFGHLLVIGIGGSALGPQLIAHALASSSDRMGVSFLDNTDPDGMDLVFSRIAPLLDSTMAIVISKSGGTKETRNGMLEAEAAYEKVGLDLAKRSVAVTGEGSDLDHFARSNGWLERFPMWDWVGGRTSVFSAVGLLPAALQGVDIDGLLTGARMMDEVTREEEPRSNPSALLALMWFYAGQGRGSKDMVIIPYKDRMQLFSRYLQQLVMESLGKERDLSGNIVHQGIAVYGNKGSTDQHAYVQQLREGINNCFVTFIEVLRDRHGNSVQVEPGVTAGDYLSSCLQGTRQALYENGRESITITVQQIDPFVLGMLIALFERAVGFYSTLVNVNAYHQPGVEAGKKAAATVIELQQKVVLQLRMFRGRSFTAESIADAIGVREAAETVFRILLHLGANPADHGVVMTPGQTLFESTFRVE